MKILTIWFRHRKTKTMLSCHNARKESLFLLGVAKVDDWRRADRVATAQCPHDAEIATSGELVNNDKIVERIPLVRADVAGQALVSNVVLSQRVDGNCNIAQLCMPVVCLLGNRALALPLLAVGCDASVNICADFLLQPSVGLCVVRTHPTSEPEGVCEGNGRHDGIVWANRRTMNKMTNK